jgi:uncharacterized membrane protein YfhO
VIAATFDTFEPHWVEQRPSYIAAPLVRRGSASIEMVKRTPVRLAARVRAAGDSEIELPLAYFPGWRVRVDGEERTTDRSPMGRMIVGVGAGAHTIEATFERTPRRLAADLISAATFILLLAFGLRRQRGTKTVSRQKRSSTIDSSMSSSAR